MKLKFNERRVLGVLVEKGFTTPEQYPLTLNYLVTAANQKSCRNPVTGLDEEQVLQTLDDLRRNGLVVLVQPAGGRTDRWRHNVKEMLGLSGEECAVIAELLLRGPQTDGELRQNAKRMRPIESLDAVHGILESLGGREPPMVVRLGPEGRRRGVRFAHTFYDDDELEALQEEELRSTPAEGSAPAPRAERSGLTPRVEALEETVAKLTARLEQLEKSLGVEAEG